MSGAASAGRRWRRPWRCAGFVAALAVAALAGCRKQEEGAATPSPDSLAPAAASVAPRDSSAARDTTAASDPLIVLREAVSRELGQPVTLEIDKRREDERWTFVTAAARTPDGQPIDYRRTKFADAVQDGVFDDWLCALLQRDGAGWTVVALEIGATDVSYVDWPERFGVPRALVLPGAGGGNAP